LAHHDPDHLPSASFYERLKKYQTVKSHTALTKWYMIIISTTIFTKKSNDFNGKKYVFFMLFMLYGLL